MRYLLTILVACAALAGCNSVPFLANAKDQIVSGVKKYCQEPQATRQTLRATVNDSLGGAATVCVQCAGDAPDATCAPPPAVKPAAPSKNNVENNGYREPRIAVQDSERDFRPLNAVPNEMAERHSGRTARDRGTDRAY